MWLRTEVHMSSTDTNERGSRTSVRTRVVPPAVVPGVSGQARFVNAEDIAVLELLYVELQLTNALSIRDRGGLCP